MRRARRSRVKEPNNSIYSAASLALRVIFCFTDVDLIRFFHGALQLIIIVIIIHCSVLSSVFLYFVYDLIIIIIICTNKSVIEEITATHYAVSSILVIIHLAMHGYTCCKFQQSGQAFPFPSCHSQTSRQLHMFLWSQNTHTANTTGDFGALTLFFGRQEGHLACKKVGYWFVDGHDLTGALHFLQLRLSPSPPSSLAPINPEWRHSGTG